MIAFQSVSPALMVLLVLFCCILIVLSWMVSLTAVWSDVTEGGGRDTKDVKHVVRVPVDVAVSCMILFVEKSISNFEFHL